MQLCMQSLSMCMAVFLGRGIQLLLMVPKEALSPSKDEEPQLWRHKSSAQSPIDPGEGQVLSSLSLTPEQVIKVICFLIPTKRDQQLFPFIVWFSSLNRTSWWSENFEPDISPGKKKKKRFWRLERNENKRAKWGGGRNTAVGGKCGWQINPSSALTLSGTWPRASPLLGSLGLRCPGSVELSVSRGREAGCGGEQDTRWNCGWAGRRRWCLRGAARHSAFRRRLAGSRSSGSAADRLGRAPACCG